MVRLLGVLSDSHDNLGNVERAAELFKSEGVEMVVHLGDIVSPFTLRLLAERLRGTRIVGVFGNNCGEKLGLLKVASKYGVELGEPPRVLELGDRKLLLLHGFGTPQLTREIVDALAVSNRWDAVLYGHTHQVDVRVVNGTLILNPGEAAGYLSGEATVALLDLEGMRAWIRRL